MEANHQRNKEREEKIRQNEEKRKILKVEIADRKE
jgi:hypothetical protein